MQRHEPTTPAGPGRDAEASDQPASETIQTRRANSKRRRAAARYERILLGLILAAAIGACLFLVSRLELRTEKQLGGWIVASFVFPTAALLLCHEPLMKLLRKLDRDDS